MAYYFELLKDWVVSLGEKHNVDPLLLGSLYLVSKMSLIFFLAWVLKNLRRNKPYVTQLLFAAISFTVPYTYIIIMGRNISIWVYLIIGVIFIYGGYTIYKKVVAKPDVSG